MALDFPDTPTVGATYTAGGISWTWDGTKWAATGAGSPGLYLPLTGGTMSGALNTTTSGAPSHVDNTIIGGTTPAAASITSLNGGQLAGFRNLIQNGDFRVSQLYGGAAQSVPAGSNWIIDRWLIATSQAKFSMGQALVTPGLRGSSPYGININCNAAYTPAAGEYFFVQQAIEGQNAAHLQWGTANALPITVSFILSASGGLTGNISVALRNGANNRSYVTLVPVTAAETLVAFTVPGDTAGTWSTDTTSGLDLSFDLGSGSSLNAPAANTWSAGNFIRLASQTFNLVGTTNANLRIKDVQIEAGSIATPFERRPFGTELALCQRYFQAPVGVVYGSGYSTAAAQLTAYATRALKVTMRAAPTQSGATFSPINCGTPSALSLGVDGCSWGGVNTAAGVFQFGISGDTYHAEI
jgi:hypothetical protein